MKEEEFKNSLKESLLEKAPDGLTDRIMESIALENSKSKINTASGIQGKSLLIFLFLLFSGTILWSFLSPSKGNGIIQSLHDKISFDLPHFEFNNLIFNNLNTYIILGFFLFLCIDILFIKKRIRIV